MLKCFYERKNHTSDMDKGMVLIVDDVPENIDVLRAALEGRYIIKAATSGEQALKILHSGDDKVRKPGLILLDVVMPGMDGYEVCRQLKSNYKTIEIPVIFVTSRDGEEDEARGFDLGAVDYITKPISPALVRRRVQTHLNLYDQKRLLDDQVKMKTSEIHDTRLQIIQHLGRAAEYKDNETGLHVLRMSHYSQELAIAAGMGKRESDLILNASPMHDIGKIGIADRILLNPGKLDKEEWIMMKKHPEIGAMILSPHHSILLNTAREIALTHHEKFNGTGYPKGLKAEEIPYPSRIVAITDVFDALTTERPYKKSWLVEDALDLIKKQAGEHFDPDLVPLFLGIMPKILAIKAQYAENS